ncbi:MFS transporter [Sphingomicrobium sediminis]|uniref:MFS transporter n=1 Tax=Sphingomicrobium sediminis TaxID=2950949 RepID=A0A9X2EHJ4_9SPHN|nr:MFS transporter [Sphingomicrobium sediminis]MCM8557677.1 MFS transporter [Sphingomicrobium sediminis]
MILAESKPLRLTMMSAFYFTQGVPNGLFLVAIPAWIVSNGGTAVETAQVVSSYMFFWIWKFLTALVMDRYTFLPMGRRRAWIITAQTVLVGALLLSAFISPPSSDIALLSAVALACGFGASTQDVGIDGLAVDILEEDERSIAAGLMYGSGMVGMAASSFAAGRIIAAQGVSAAFFTGAAVVGAVLLMGLLLKEREGERRFPWSKGNAHPRNLEIKLGAWWPLLRNSVRAILKPVSILFVIAFMISSMPSGVAETFHPVLGQEIAGWELTTYTDRVSMFGLGAGVFAMTIGGWIVGKTGEPRAFRVLFAALAIACFAFALVPDQWTDSRLVIAILIAFPFATTMITVAAIPMGMRLCDPSVAATQYTVYMALSNFGRPLGAGLAAGITASYAPQYLYFALGGILLVACIIAVFTKLPLVSVASVKAVEAQTPQVEDEPVPEIPATA